MHLSILSPTSYTSSQTNMGIVARVFNPILPRKLYLIVQNLQAIQFLQFFSQSTLGGNLITRYAPQIGI